MKLALLMIDLDKFKPVNDTYGHQTGDNLLQKVASVLKRVSRETDIVARLGGDEFAILLVEPGSKITIKSIAQRIIDELKKPILIEQQNINIGVSIGVSTLDAEQNKEALIREADLALYEAKKMRMSALKFFKE